MRAREKLRALARRARAATLATWRSTEEQYATALRRVMADVEREMLRALDLRQDASKVDPTIDRVALDAFQSIRGKVDPAFSRAARAVDKKNLRALRRLGVNPALAGVAAEIEAAREKNIRLVEKAARAYAQDVREVFSDPENFGKTSKELRDLLLERGSVSKSRAELIARDQVLKLNGAITQARQQKAGIESYTWSTSLDDRVRPEHRELEGRTFHWSAPPSVGHPGEDISCRCVAVPNVPESDL